MLLWKWMNNHSMVDNFPVTACRHVATVRTLKWIEKVDQYKNKKWTSNTWMFMAWKSKVCRRCPFKPQCRVKCLSLLAVSAWGQVLFAWPTQMWKGKVYAFLTSLSLSFTLFLIFEDRYVTHPLRDPLGLSVCTIKVAKWKWLCFDVGQWPPTCWLIKACLPPPFAARPIVSAMRRKVTVRFGKVLLPHLRLVQILLTVS